ncbi:MAG: hypothetical protein M3290_10125, partial [Actinomycetota bacterium]|nr:hypothetical protein [Actinomycetota bacterium]
MRGAAAVICVVAVLMPAGVANASSSDCSHAVVVTTPAVTWADVARYHPRNIEDQVAAGAAGSIAVRTITSRTSYASGFA